MTLTRTFPTDSAGLPLADTRLLVAAMVESDTTGKPRAGVLPSHYNPLVTGTAGMAYSVAAFAAVTARAGMGAELVANDGAATVATTAAPGANSRIDVIWVRSLFTTTGDAGTDPVFGVTQGTAAPSPLKPSIPAGALELATAVVLSTTTQTSTAVITQTFVYTATQGGCVPVRNATELAAWAPANGAEAFRLDTGLMYVRSGDAWRLSRGYDRGTFAGATDGSGLVTVNHGLGVSPMVVIVMDQNSGAVPNTRKIVRSATSSTQIQFYVTNGGNALPGNPVVFDWVAFL